MLSQFFPLQATQASWLNAAPAVGQRTGSDARGALPCPRMPSGGRLFGTFETCPRALTMSVPFEGILGSLQFQGR